MKAVKFMISGALLILLGPAMAALDVTFSGLMLVCWLVGVPLFLVGLIMPEKGFGTPGPMDELPQKECPACGKKQDFDYPKCPYCGHDHSTAL